MEKLSIFISFLILTLSPFSMALSGVPYEIHINICNYSVHDLDVKNDGTSIALGTSTHKSTANDGNGDSKNCKVTNMVYKIKGVTAGTSGNIKFKLKEDKDSNNNCTFDIPVLNGQVNIQKINISQSGKGKCSYSNFTKASNDNLNYYFSFYGSNPSKPPRNPRNQVL